jgi:uncharacterized protein (UPF0335 family)
MAANVKGKKGAKPKKAKKKAAPKVSAKASGPTLDAATSPTRAASAISKPDLLKILKRCSSLDSSLASTRGDIAAIVQDAEARHNLHRKAFSLCRRLHRMDDTKLAEFLYHFDVYREHLELDAAAGEDLFEDRPPAEPEPGAEPDKPKRSRRKTPEPSLADAMGEAMEADKPEFGPDAEKVDDEERAALH